MKVAYRPNSEKKESARLSSLALFQVLPASPQLWVCCTSANSDFKMENMAASEADVMETSMMSQSSTLSAPASMSMRQKSQLKRRINKEHNSNFRAGYVPVNEVYLHKAGIRGRKRYLLYTCVIVLLVFAVLNTAMTAWLLWIYQISHEGMRPMEFTYTSEGFLLRFLKEARFNSLSLNGALLGSRRGKDLIFSGTNAQVLMSTSHVKNESMVEIMNDMVRFSVDDLILMTPSGKQYFTFPNLKINRLKNVNNLHADLVEAREIRNAPNFDDLSIESWNKVVVTGDQGIKTFSGRETIMRAHNLNISSLNGTLVFDGLVGMYISSKIPWMQPGTPADLNISTSKICVCGNNGRVFSVPATSGRGCSNANELINPCLD